MIVTCEQCQTRFQLDASRIPATGARVRCSRCKHAFFVVQPGAAARDAAVHAIADEAAEAGAASVPSATQDLGTLAPLPASDNTSATRLMPLGTPSAGDAADVAPSLDPESDWQFNEPVRDALPSPLREARRPASRRAAPAPAEDDSSLDALGSPDSWDILGDASLPPLESVPTTPAGKGAAPVAPVAGEAGRASAPAARTPEASRDAPTSVARLPASARWRGSPRDVALFAGVWLWIAAVAGVALLPQAPASHAGAVPTPAGVTIESLRGRFLDNAVAGPLFVVTGEWKGGTAGRDGGGAPAPDRLEIVVLGPRGEVARAPLGDAPSEQRLREAPPDALADEIAGSPFARGPVAVQGARRVAAVLPAATHDATEMRVEVARGAEAAPIAH